MDNSTNTKSKVEQAKPSDLTDIMGLVNQEQWAGYHVNDLKLALNVSPENCFVIRHEKVIASCFALVSNGVGYISYLLVDKEHRLGKIGITLGSHCLRETIKKSEVVIIYANQKLVQHYARYGFKPQYEVRRFELSIKKNQNLLAFESEELNQDNYSKAQRLMKQVYPVNRDSIYKELLNFENFTFRIHLDEEGNADVLIGLFSLDETSVRLGPLITSNREKAAQLMNSVVAQNQGKTLFCEAGSVQFRTFLEESEVNGKELDVAVEKMFFGNEKLLEKPSDVIIEGGHHFS